MSKLFEPNRQLAAIAAPDVKITLMKHYMCNVNYFELAIILDNISTQYRQYCSQKNVTNASSKHAPAKIIRT